MTESWRPVIAALANVDLQPVVARMLLGATAAEAMHGIPASKERRLLGALERSGLLAGDVLDREVFARLLEEAAEPKREGVQRFLDGDRIEQYPANLTERGELLAWVASRALAPDEVVDEATLNARLERFTADTALLRRYLVDALLLERTRDGSQYSRAPLP